MINEERIDINPDIYHGKPRVKGIRIMISLILEWLEAGKIFEEIIETYPELSSNDISAAIKYARKVLEEENSARIS